MAVDQYDLQGPCPEGAVFVGPRSWLDSLGGDPRPETFDDPRVALDRLRADAAAAGPLASSRLVVVHDGAFAAADDTALLEHWLAAATSLRIPLLPVLLHGRLDASALVRCFRAGLFDAVTVPVSQSAWLNMMVRVERRREQRDQSRQLLTSQGQTQDVLRHQRRQLGREAVGYADDLLQAQAELEAANQRLTGAMAELSLLHHFGRKLGSARNWDDVLREILQKLVEFVGAGGAALVLRSAPEGAFTPRQTWQWEESAWDRVLVSLQDQVDGAVAESIMAPGVFRVDPDDGTAAAATSPRRIIALPLEHQDLRLGYLMLLFASTARRDAATERYLPFLQAVQVVLAEEVAGAQMLDRIRNIGTFNARVLETVSSAIWVIDAQGRSVYVNRAAQTLLTGKAPVAGDQEDFLLRVGRGRRIRPLSQDTALPELLLDARLQLDACDGPLLTFLHGHADGVYRGEGLVAAADGERIPVLLQSRLMAGRSRGEQWLVIVAEDLRETRKLETERLRAEQLEGLVEMSATLAHEIRNPLMGLSAQAELLAGQLPANDERSRYIDVITREVERIDDTITRMLNFVRPYEPTNEPIALGGLLADAVELARPRAAAADVSLIFVREEVRGDRLNADGAQLKQVLLNLLLNAVDAAGAGGQVRTTVTGGEVVLADAGRGTRQATRGCICEVRDTGPGVANEDRSRIFRPFFTTKSSGTGLGLSICHKIVTAHGGEITVDRDGSETVFRVVLPADAAMPPAALEEEV